MLPGLVLLLVAVALALVLVWGLAWVARLLGLPVADAAVTFGSATAMVFATVVLVAVTARYVALTGAIATATRDEAQASRDMVDRMADATRPLLVPVADPARTNSALVASLGDLETLTGLVVHDYLILHNIGLGPAVNVGIEVDAADPLRGWSIPAGLAGARPIAPGSKEPVYQWKERKAKVIPEGGRLTIVYDDILGRHFRTTARRTTSDWHNIETAKVEAPAAPRRYSEPAPE